LRQKWNNYSFSSFSTSDLFFERRNYRSFRRYFTSTAHSVHFNHFRLAVPRKSKLRNHWEIKDYEGFLMFVMKPTVLYLQTMTHFTPHSKAFWFRPIINYWNLCSLAITLIKTQTIIIAIILITIIIIIIIMIWITNRKLIRAEIGFCFGWR